MKNEDGFETELLEVVAGNSGKSAPLEGCQKRPFNHFLTF